MHELQFQINYNVIQPTTALYYFDEENILSTRKAWIVDNDKKLVSFNYASSNPTDGNNYALVCPGGV